MEPNNDRQRGSSENSRSGWFKKDPVPGAEDSLEKSELMGEYFLLEQKYNKMQERNKKLRTQLIELGYLDSQGNVIAKDIEIPVPKGQPVGEGSRATKERNRRKTKANEAKRLKKEEEESKRKESQKNVGLRPHQRYELEADFTCTHCHVRAGRFCIDKCGHRFCQTCIAEANSGIPNIMDGNSIVTCKKCGPEITGKLLPIIDC